MWRLGLTFCFSVFVFAIAAPAYAVDPPNNCPVAPPTPSTGGYVHGGIFSSEAPGAYTGVSMKVDELAIRGGSRDHAHGTLVIQSDTWGNYYEVGIGIFGHRSITTPHLWSFYRSNLADVGTFTDLGQAELTRSYRILFERIGYTNYYDIEIDGFNVGAPQYVDADWFGAFNENYNENNTLCEWLHVSYSTSTNVLDRRGFDPQFDSCHWQIFHSWEVYWETQSPFYCNPPDPEEPPDGPHPTFPSSPVLP